MPVEVLVQCIPISVAEEEECKDLLINIKSVIP